MSSRIAFLKGHGTENDFVIVPDPDNAVDLSPAAVAALCDRRAGIGGDGVLHVVRSAAHPEARAMAARAEWFMDYRNSDGSVAEMCGNGVRVFARYLQRAGHATAGDLAIATRGGVKTVHLAKDGDITVGMGKARLPEQEVTVRVGERSWPARNVDMGNPHAVAFVEDLAHAGDLLTPPAYSPASAYPDGVNVEFVVDRGPRHVAMRVHERGSGETRSCGTGACAVAVAAARRDGADPAVTGTPVTYTVDVPGGRLVITERPDGEIEMTGPAVIVAEGELDRAWLDEAVR
ncbi:MULTISPECIES: diaminopimelate epimerase [Streptomyces]|jgi:diaminopimelate epimerase|uniref:Diaminopimelate epimerase n=1 Tax=Streptomyces thermoviolaceus subsp. thermoviolaceus TaxID=66860 RepID=A0ABX0YKZ9_STRTL|nr:MULTISPECIES: diaminopimelate epimerase [Streptomyces]MCM3263209.1 diaminopimelate epimerase [Streptomyces thermoviolaceus]NJP13074.1 diaminopimelate epimerase [Streptomyces thermoviolaceus subsp. thermoviolaceus]RSS03867.1 diaminopimelate epimerase [Streptomyces sp. WAC00469]WTD47091.1 diaminopimelate epimerase [Streptomyces thermoviolaceus]GGV78532.1 diaminopimelate epimerase [Streptomyces thermoviolaceus subsp. apingens]